MHIVDRLLVLLAALVAGVVALLLIATMLPTSSHVAAPQGYGVALPGIATATPLAAARSFQPRKKGGPPPAMQVSRLQTSVERPVGNALPAAVAPLAVPNNQQERNLNCEFRSAADLAAYYGYTISWQALFLAVGWDPNGDPDVGFVGRSIDDPPGGVYPDGYGVHAGPIASGLSELGIQAAAYRGEGIEWLKAQIALGHPVMVWATAGLLPSQVVEWQTVDGRTVTGVPSEHTFTAIGYDQLGIWLNDPWGGSTDYYEWERFEAGWDLLGQQAVVIEAPLR